MALILPPYSFPPPAPAPNHTIRIPGVVNIAQLAHFITAQHGQIDLNTFRDYQIAINGFQHLFNPQIDQQTLDDLAQQGATVILETGSMNNWHLEKGKVTTRNNPVTGNVEYVLSPQGIVIQPLRQKVLVPNSYQVPTTKTTVIVGSKGTRIIPGHKTIAAVAAPSKPAPPTAVSAQADTRQVIGAAILAWSGLSRPRAGRPILQEMLAADAYEETPRKPTSNDVGKKAILSRGGNEGNVWKGVLELQNKPRIIAGKSSAKDSESFYLAVTTPGQLQGQKIIIQASEILYFAKDN